MHTLVLVKCIITSHFNNVPPKPVLAVTTVEYTPCPPLGAPFMAATSNVCSVFDRNSGVVQEVTGPTEKNSEPIRLRLTNTWRGNEVCPCISVVRGLWFVHEYASPCSL